MRLDASNRKYGVDSADARWVAVRGWVAAGVRGRCVRGAIYPGRQESAGVFERWADQAHRCWHWPHH